MRAQFVIPVLASILILGSLGFSQQSFAQIPPGFVDFDGHCYGFTASTSWAVSESIAVSFGGHLVTINNIAENTFIQTTLVPAGDHVWIGYNDIAVEGSFVWVSGEVVVPLFENWSATNPDNGGGSEDVTAFKFPEGEWNDFFSSPTIPTLGAKLQGIIELDATCASVFTPQPKEQAESLIEDVEDLPLDNKDSTKLTKSLDKILKALDNEDTVTACDQLNKFIKDTQKLIDKGKLDATDGQTLIDSATDLKDTIP